MRSRSRDVLARYALALVAVGCAVGLRLLVEPLTGSGAPWVVFFTAVVIVSVYAGAGPGLLTVTVSAPVAAYLFSIRAGFSVSQAAAQAVLFMVDGAAVVYLTALLSRRQHALNAAEQRFRSTLARSPVVVMTNDRDLRYTWIHNANPGLDGSSILGKTDAEIFPPDEAALLTRLKRQVLDTGLPAREQLTLTFGGKPFTYELSLDPVRDAEGQVQGLSGVAIDVTTRAEAEEALRQSQARGRAVLDSLLEGVVFVDGDGKVEALNPAAGLLLGCDPAELSAPQSGLRSRLVREDGSAFPTEGHPILGALRKGQVLRDVRMGLRKPDGSTQWLAFNAQHVHDAAGEFEGAVISFFDISARKLAERDMRESEERLRLAVEAAGIGLWDLDLDEKALRLSPELHDLLGIGRKSVPSVDFAQALIHPEDLPAVVQAQARSLDPAGDGRMRVEFRIQRSDGGVRWLACLGRTWSADTPGERIARRAIGAVVDVSTAHQVAEELRQAGSQKDEFMAMLSHELRNPLAAIRSNIYLLDHSPAEGELAKQAVRVIDRQVGQLARLVDDLLDVARITRGKLHLRRERIELNGLLQRVLEDHRVALQGRGLALHAAISPPPLFIDGDPARIVQLLGNLVHNAAKFTPSGGRVQVSLTRDAGQAVLHVSDTGVGIVETDLPRLFQPFTQLGATLSRTEGGLGLGLSLVRLIAELHQGTVVARSAGPGLGSEFTIRLPLALGADAPAPSGSSASQARGQRVLIIEDNHDIAEGLSTVLELMGHTVHVAHDGESGVFQAQKLHPQLVLCDIGLPDIDGYEVARRLRADPALGGSLLVALSGYGQPEDLRRSADAGFARHLTKPSSIEAIEDLLVQAAQTVH